VERSLLRLSENTETTRLLRPVATLHSLLPKHYEA
jgi:hypothetical protein